jgi:hypothetical protein
MTSAMIAGTAEPWPEGWLSLAATGGALLITGDAEDEALARADVLPGEDAAAVPPGPVLRAEPAAGRAVRAAG